MNVGYARVSTAEQTLDLQLDALKKAECSQIYSDTASGGNTNVAVTEGHVKILK
jgi:DNA invertase Pin-like site-specific DNA recombinase